MSFDVADISFKTIKLLYLCLLALEPPKPVPSQSVLPGDDLRESQAKPDPFSASPVSSKIKTYKTKNDHNFFPL